MFATILLLMAIAVMTVLAVLGGRWVSRDDARRAVRNEATGAHGWLPDRADALLLHQARVELERSRRTDA